MSGELRAGAARMCITPPFRVPQSGFYARKGKRSEGVHDDLYSKALVLDDGEQTVAIVANDLVEIPRPLVLDVRKQIHKETGIRPGNIMICVIHTHSGPTLEDKAYREFLQSQMVGAVCRAWNDAKDALIGVGEGLVTSASFNRQIPRGPIDPIVGVTRVDKKEGGIIAVVMNFSCHATVMGPDNLLISADYPGYATRLVEKMTGEETVALFTRGSGGDQSPSSSKGYISDQTPYSEARRIGHILGFETLKVLEEVMLTHKVDVRVRTTMREMLLEDARRMTPLHTARRIIDEDTATIRKLKAAGSDRNVIERVERKLQFDKENLRIWIAMTDKARKRPSSVSLKKEIQVIAVNDWALVGIPGESFVQIGLKVKEHGKELGYSHTWTIDLCNDAMGGYIVVPEGMEEYGYEAYTARLAHERPDAWNMIVRASSQILKQFDMPKFVMPQRPLFPGYSGKNVTYWHLPSVGDLEVERSITKVET